MMETELQQFLDKAREIFPDASWIRRSVPLSSLTTFRIGGPAEVVLEPLTEEDLLTVLGLLQQAGITPLTIGRGSNLLVCDEGYRGVVLHLGENLSAITVNGTHIHAMAGASLASLARVAEKNSLTGLEFASGIPGTVGGGIYMNAGAYGGELATSLRQVTVLPVPEDNTTAYELLTLPVADLSMEYRNTRFMRENWIILSADFELTPGDPRVISKTMKTLNSQRREKQPLEYPSAGSFFKRPEGYFAGKLIQDAGLKGLTVGGASISIKHAGFLINTGNATCQDVLALTHQVQQTVQQIYGVHLEPEVRYLSATGLTPMPDNRS